ncbi:MAG: hypothetical protein A2020_01975 [Lentisphaerae bacterium GWF2_45_14]|nr:MAG: hypothetical protein A2020_01975 [Lentisphaerae bacterium GWF2_45_14]
MDENFKKSINRIVDTDPRYAVDAYEFVSIAVNYTAHKLKKHREKEKPDRHVSAKELLDGIADYALREFGPMASEVMKSWGLTNAKAIGNVVFNMIGERLLKASEEDCVEDFSIEYDFDETLRKPFIRENAAERSINPPMIA